MLCIILGSIFITAASAIEIVLVPCNAWLCGDRPTTHIKSVRIVVIVGFAA
jgi:hypothetical protein